MLIGIKDILKLFGITVVSACAVFVCTLFLNYNIDLVSVGETISGEAGRTMYEAVVSMGKITAAVSGGCLVLTAVAMLVFYIKNFVDAHGKELGILKALGYSSPEIAKHFCVFGLSVFFGCLIGFVAAFLYLPRFYSLNNSEGLFPDIPVTFHPLLAVLLICVPPLFFSVLSVLFALMRLRTSAIDMIREKNEVKSKVCVKENENLSFLGELRRTTLRGRKILAFFVAFSAFCFSAMLQMSLSMKRLASEKFAFMIFAIGMILAFMSLFMSLSSVLKANAKTVAMMKVFGYDERECSRAVIGCYRPVSYVGFIIGTGYQYALLKIMMTFVFSDIEYLPEYGFDFKALAITLVLFVVSYEAVMFFWTRKLGKTSVKSVMAE